MLRVKGSDTLCPVGPALVTSWDFHGKAIRTYVDGEVVQDGNSDVAPIRPAPEPQPIHRMTRRRMS